MQLVRELAVLERGPNATGQLVLVVHGHRGERRALVDPSDQSQDQLARQRKRPVVDIGTRRTPTGIIITLLCYNNTAAVGVPRVRQFARRRLCEGVGW